MLPYLARLVRLARCSQLAHLACPPPVRTSLPASTNHTRATAQSTTAYIYTYIHTHVSNWSESYLLVRMISNVRLCMYVSGFNHYSYASDTNSRSVQVEAGMVSGSDLGELVDRGMDGIEWLGCCLNSQPHFNPAAPDVMHGRSSVCVTASCPHAICT